MKKRFLAVILALVLCVGLVPPAFAMEEDFTIEYGVLIKYNGPGGDVVIPDGVTEIYNFAFSGCRGLTSVVIPDSVTKIGDWTFNQCENLINVTIPDSVTEIGDIAFAHCTNLTSITIPSSVTHIGGQAFSGCTSLTSITIPDSVTSIEYHTFSDCINLVSITIPDSVTDIGSNAFFHCPSLTDVYYASNQAHWDLVEIEDYNESLKNANIHFARPTIEPLAKFTDLKPNGYYLDAVGWAVNLDITTGKTETSFQPETKCTHAEILTFLWRAAGEPEAWYDVDTKQFSFPVEGFYADAVKWAYSYYPWELEGFNPKAPCNRADAVRYISMALGGYAEYDGRFTDVPAGSPYATAVAWAVEKGVTTGTTATTFSPAKICNRGEIVTFLYRAYK